MHSLATSVRTARQHTLGDLPLRSARRYPDKVAIVDGRTRMTYAELDAVIDRTVAALADLGLTKGDRLALLSRNRWEFVVLSFATARLGVILVPINFMLQPEEVAYILEHCEPRAFVTEVDTIEVACMAVASASAAMIGTLAVIGGAAPRGWVDGAVWFEHDSPASSTLVAVEDDDPIRLMYTSGTESRPKGVLHSSRSLLAQYVSCIVDGGMTGDDIELHSLPMYHCAQLDCFLGPDVYLGATSIILPGPNPQALLETIETERVTKLFAPPTVWISLLRCEDFDSTDLSSLKKCYYGASAMPVEVLAEIQGRLPNVSLWNFYGQTEMAPVATILPPNEQMSHLGSAGRPALNVETRVVSADTENTDPLPAGEVGEIVHRSPHAMLGYYKSDPKTADAFRGGWFRSGDLGYFDDEGRLYVVDRKKDMIKSGGENVSSREVEEAIYTAKGVAEVAVFGVHHPKWVESVVAVVVPMPGAQLTEDDIIGHSRHTLAAFKRPKHVVIVDALPKNPSGKILKRDLRDRYVDIAVGGSN